MSQRWKIKELASELHVSTRTIRFYEEKGLITPEKDPDNGYRVFGERDMIRLRMIISLREFGMSVEQVKQLLGSLEQGRREEALHTLELQRSAMFDSWMESKQQLEAADYMIDCLRTGEDPEWGSWFAKAGGLKRQRQLRNSWQDNWDFDSRAAIHDELVKQEELQSGGHPAYSDTLRFMVERVQPQPGEKGIDMGTGTGNLAGLFAAEGAMMAGIDQSTEMLKQCRRKFPHIDVRPGNLMRIPFVDGSFDFAVSSYAMHHLADEQKYIALGEICRVLQPHGRICIADVMQEPERWVSAALSDDSVVADQAGRLEERPVDYLSDDWPNPQPSLQPNFMTDPLSSSMSDPLANHLDKQPAYYVTPSFLTEWLEQHGYVTITRRVAGPVYMVYAVPVHYGQARSGSLFS
ncbi:MerR family transcriptional regulator [Paenibacillus massiliensis]|uniref:MerR family transcriptional regulator n=1 Tax=Paenibacillus massiliensis TaxID=225917 RepID=UPI00041DC748|nr:MerR family transcriptional regulator [Paenibacillus massiliensis]